MKLALAALVLLFWVAVSILLSGCFPLWPGRGASQRESDTAYIYPIPAECPDGIVGCIVDHGIIK